MSAIGGPAAITSGLVLNLDAGNVKSYPGSGTTWRDTSGNARNGTLINGPTFNTGSLGSIVFDGTNDYIDLPHVFDISSGGVTWNIWFRATSLAWSPLISDWYDNQWSFNLQIYLGTVNINIRNSNNVNFPSANNFSINANQIYNLTCTYDKTTKQILTYLNNTLIYSSTNTESNSAIRNTSNNWSIGYKQDSENYYTGNIYIAQMYNRALNPSEILQNFNATRARFGI